jgi:hypothetical protein
MSWITDTWRAAVDGARTWGREASTEWRDTVREIAGPADADRWAAERARQAAAGPTWLARDGGRVVEVDAEGYPGREADLGDGRPVVEAEDDARDTDYQRWAQQAETGQATGNPPASAALDPEIDRATQEWPEVGAAQAINDPSSGEWWDARAASEPAGSQALDGEPGQHDQPWWDGERMATDRQRSPGLAAELEAEAG